MGDWVQLSIPKQPCIHEEREMRAPIKAVHRPETWDEVFSLLSRAEVPTALSWIGARPEPVEEIRVEELVDLRALQLDYIDRVEDGSIRIGSLTSIQTLVESDHIQGAYGGLLSKAARHTDHYGLRNLITLGGVLSRPGGPPDIPLALLVLNAEIVSYGAEGQLMDPLEQVYAQDVGDHLQVIAEVRIPSDPGRVGTALEWVARSPMDESIVAVAAYMAVEGEEIKTVRIAAACTGVSPLRVRAAERRFGTGLWEASMAKRAGAAAMESLDPEGDFRASADYQTEIIGVLTQRALTNAWNDLR